MDSLVIRSMAKNDVLMFAITSNADRMPFANRMDVDLSAPVRAILMEIHMIFRKAVILPFVVKTAIANKTRLAFFCLKDSKTVKVFAKIFNAVLIQFVAEVVTRLTVNVDPISWATLTITSLVVSHYK
jgi:hypothetical protein